MKGCVRAFFVLVEERKRLLDALPLGFEPVFVLHVVVCATVYSRAQHFPAELSLLFACVLWILGFALFVRQDRLPVKIAYKRTRRSRVASGKIQPLHFPVGKYEYLLV